ncbi:MAG: cation-translocating P-type ATPase [Gemmatimonadota bacterium]|nr:cation-translocating P-type ATPase [Gemmatimonadota bacterium]
MSERPARPADGAPGSSTDQTRRERLVLTVPDMDCAGCLATINDRLCRVPGVEEVEGSPMRRRLDIVYDETLAESDGLRREVERLGYATETLDEAGATRELGPDAATPGTWAGRQARIAYASAGLFALAGLLHLAGVSAPTLSVVGRSLRPTDVLFIVSALVGGWNFFPKGVRAARALALDMNFLMTVAILGAVGIGEYAEGAAIAFLFAVAELLERYAVDRARTSVQALMQLTPDTAAVRRHGDEVRVGVEELVPGDVVVVRPGDRLPVDGTVVEGHSAVDQAPVTGESMPVEKEVGGVVFAGTINREGFLAVRVDRPTSESTLARIIRLVEEAEARKTRTERFIDRFARVYTPAVTLAAVAVVVLPVLFFGGSFSVWFTRGLTLLVIACPCALVISTPVAVVSGVTAAARRGVLIKGGTYLEAFGEVRAIALDKTGTLTFGRPAVVDVSFEEGVDPLGLLSEVAAVEARSEHPVGRAIVEYARASGARPTGRIEGFAATPGRGVRATVEGRDLAVGTPDFALAGARSRAPWPEEEGTAIAVAVDGRLAAWFRIADRTRASARDTLDALRAGGVEHLVMLTGDAPATADVVGRELGVDEVRAGLLPEDKVEAVRELTRRYGPVAMVGDGINDAPALATAGVGVVMGAAGSDAALETADIALMGDDLARLPYVRNLSRESVRVIRTNIVLALAVKVVLAVGVPFGAVSLIAAVLIGDMGVSLAVTVNALRLGRVGRPFSKGSADLRSRRGGSWRGGSPPIPCRSRE